MSSTRGGDAIDPTNLFTTPAWAVDAIIPHLPIGGVIVDAGCGEGAILSRLRLAAPNARLFGVERDSDRSGVATARRDGTIYCADWLDPDMKLDADLVVMNPPFILAETFILRAREFTGARHGTIAALLRANWHIPACRVPFTVLHPFDMGTLSRRPEFVASLKCKAKCGWKLMQKIDAPRPKVCPDCGLPVTVVTTDSSDYAWHLWGPGRGGRFFRLAIPAREP